MKNISNIGATVFWKIAIAAGLVFFYILSKFTQKRIEYPVLITCNGKLLKLPLSHFIDFIVAYEVFVLQQYKDLTGHEKITFALDLGANVGFSTLYLATHYPHASVVAVEPDSHTFFYLKKNTSNFPNIKCIHAAISDREGEVVLYVHPRSSLSSSIINRDITYVPKKVPSITLKNLIDTHIHSLDVLKFDIEGAEGALFGDSDRVPMFRYITGEYHADIVGKPVETFVDTFKKHNITVSPISKSRYIVSAKIKDV